MRRAASQKPSETGRNHRPLRLVTEALGEMGDVVAQDQRPGGGPRARHVIVAGLAAAVLAAAYVCLPRHADLTRFDPSTMARL
jgi:hypothetical protein